MIQQISMIDEEQRVNDNEQYVRRISYNETKPFLLGIHYARRMPCITDAFGLFLNGEMIGVATYGVPASRPLCVGLAGEENAYHVLELNRLVILPEYNGKNYASYLVAHSLKQLPRRTFVVSYADTAWSHVGYVYQATNWLYTGMSAKRVDTYQPGGGTPKGVQQKQSQRIISNQKRKAPIRLPCRKQKRQKSNAKRIEISGV